MKKIILILLALFFITGCSTRQYFEPKKNELQKPILLKKTISSPIIYFTDKVATLKDGTVLPTNEKLPKGFIAIDQNLSKKGNILRINNKNITFKKLIVTASKKNNLVAILFNDNYFELYDLNQNKAIFSNQFGATLALRKFVAQPYFYKDLLLIPSLDGIMAVFDLKANKIIRSVVVSQKDYFNNIIYLNVKNDNLIVASRDKILVVSPGMVFEKSYNIKHILVDDGIYVFTIEGNIIKLNFALKKLKEKEFKFANIIEPMFYKNKIYFLSRGGKSLLFSIDKDLNKYTITPLTIVQNDQCWNNFINLHTNVFGYNGTYYIGDYILKLK